MFGENRMEKLESFTKYERARILGARALQIAMDAPVLIKFDEEAFNGFNFDPLKIAELELDSGILPISVKRPMPKKVEKSIDKVKIKKETESEEKTEKTEGAEEKEEKVGEEKIEEESEIMELANPEEEGEEENSGAGFEEF